MPPVVILAGGVAARLRPITQTVPKALLIVAGKPFIAHQLDLLRKNGIKKVVICSGYLSQQIEDFVGDGSQYGLSIAFCVDGEKLLGTGGAVKKALPLLEEQFFVMYGDSYLTVNFQDVYDYFLKNPGIGLMTVLKNQNAWDKSNIVFEGGKITTYDKNNKIKGMDYIDYGLGILRKSAFDVTGFKNIFDLSEIYQYIISKKQMSGYEVTERFYEIGSLSGLAETEKYLLNLRKREK
ncbi:MAG: NTP transferase domain-containing protein [Candidatus Omnitrophica bacterium]|nr:NTP transferase domain-containing protein [Candidatus Omnitrophota bacterium]